MSFRILCAALFLALALPASADETKPVEDEGRDDAKTETTESEFVKATTGDKVPEKTTYTNEDLERLFGPPPEREPEPEVEASEDEEGEGESRPRPRTRPVRAKRGDGESAEAEGDGDPMAWIEERRAEEAERRERVAEAEAKVREARERVARLEQTRLRVSNPYLGIAPEPPEGVSDWNALDNKERLARTVELLDKARQDLRDAEAALADASP
jgi:hypothetical protein